MSTPAPRRNKFLRTVGIVLLAGLLVVAAYEIVTAGQFKTLTDSRKFLGAEATVQTLVRQGDDRRGQEAIRQAMVEIERIDKLVGTDSSGSELSQLIAAKQGQFVPLSPATVEILEQAGVPQWLTLMPAGAVRQADGEGLDLSERARQYAAEQAIDAMKQTGVAGGSVNIGGAVRRFGRQASAN